VLLIRSAEPVRAVLGFESGARPLDLRPDVLTGLTMALAAILQAARRQILDGERIQLERRLARARRMETIGQMASGVAHNFNNIIGAIGGFGEMAEAHTRTGSVARRNIIEIRQAVDRGRDLVDEILNFAKQDRGEKQPIDMSRLVEDALRLFHASTYGGVEVESSPPLVAGDVIGAAGQVQQVLLNILNNAASANSDRGTIGLEVWSATRRRRTALSHSSVEPGSYLVITIMDHGTGISPIALPRIFEPFFTTRPGGTGLGLSTAWEIVQDHGGTIDVHSELGVGSRFNIWLPLASGDGARQPPSQPIGNGERILLLCSDEMLATDEEILADLGYEPVGRAISDNIPPAQDLINAVDAILVANPTPDQLAQLVNSLAPVLAYKPLLIAADSARRVMCGLSSDTLRYPMQQAAVAPALSRLMHSADRMTASR
jgi:signal transduction histidine kinase